MILAVDDLAERLGPVHEGIVIGRLGDCSTDLAGVRRIVKGQACRCLAS